MCARKKGGEATGPSPVDRRKTGSKHHLLSDGGGIPFHVITTAANVNDVTQTLALVDGIPPVAGRVGHPRKCPDALLGDKGYDSTSQPPGAAKAPDPADHLPQGISGHHRSRQAPLRRRADLRPAPRVLEQDTPGRLRPWPGCWVRRGRTTTPARAMVRPAGTPNLLTEPLPFQLTQSRATAQCYTTHPRRSDSGVQR
ncbi:transposase [Streptomyces sp. NPDC007901]|uniref:transposase n=1 Tax=Streptomyces sp. NPDC007901 TaxID=3364785 RepID=UPI0036EB3D24